MKEFNAQTGGRYTYVDDIVNLQELALAFASVFDECDNFIISGCEVSGTTISSGYVYINGKIRHFSGASGIVEWPQYLYESNRTETVAYASGDSKVGRNIYGCAIASEVPGTQDNLTGETPAFIKITSEGGMRMNDAFFGKYALLLQSAIGTQTVKDIVTFSKNVNVHGVLTTSNSLSIVNHQSVSQIFYSGDSLVVQSRVGQKRMHMTINSNDGFQFFIDNNPLCTIGANEIAFKKPVVATTVTTGNICVKNNDIFNNGHADNNACVNINVTGYQDGASYYRNTIIGDGKRNAIIKVTGSTKNVHIQGDLSIDSPAIASLSLRKNKLVQWLDGTDNQIAYVGYNNNSTFEVTNTVASITISAIEFVNIAPAIKENGELLSEKYATRNYLTSELNKKANADNVYTKNASDDKYATKNGGLDQLKGTYNNEELCTQIGAALKTQVEQDFIKVDGNLGEFVNSSNKKTICNNIGAAYAQDYQLKLKDTGWIQTSSSNGNSGGNNNLYARQIGKVVCIQGKAKVSKDDEWYIAIPSKIDPPKYAVSVTYRKNSTSYWSGWIEGGSYHIKTANHNNIDGDEIPITITYMTA